MKEEDEEEEQKTEEEQKDLAETIEESETEEVSEKEGVKKEEGEEKVEEVVEAEEAEAEEMPAPVEEEAKPPPKKEKIEEEEIVEERIYTVPLSKAWIMPPNKRAPRAMRMIRSFITKHMKLEARREGEEEEEPKKLVVSNEVNEKVWERGIEKPPRKIRVRAAKDKDGNITVYLAEGD
jgi:large subunit ribosomal protein L31e